MSKRQRTVQTWAEHCGNPNALDVSARWYSCVAAHVIIGDRLLRGVAEMLSTHFLLIDDDGEVIFDAAVGDVISVERRQEVAVGENMSLGGDTSPIIRTCIELVVRSRGVSDTPENETVRRRQSRQSVLKKNASKGSMRYSATHCESDSATRRRQKKRLVTAGEEDNAFQSDDEDTDDGSDATPPLSARLGDSKNKNNSTGKLISHATEYDASDSAFASQPNSSRKSDEAMEYGGGGSNSNDAVVPITFVLEGPEGAHFAAGMELLWRRKFRMLSLRDQAMCRCSHISDFIYTVAMLPIDVDCVLLQEIFPPNYRPSINGLNTLPSAADSYGASSFAAGPQSSFSPQQNLSGGGAYGSNSSNSPSSPYASASGVTVNRDRSAVLRIDQNYVLRIIPRPENIYDALAVGSVVLPAGGSPTAGAAVGSPASASQQQFPLAASPSTQLATQQWAFHLSDVLLITHNDNQLRIVVSDGRVLILGSVDTRTVYGSAEQRPVTAGNDGINSANAVGAVSGGVGAAAGATSASNLALERRKAEASATKAATGIDITAMTAGSRNILDIFLFFASTACYQQLFLTARGITKPNTGNKSATFDSPDFENESTAKLMPPVIPPAACFSSNDLYRVYHHYCSIDVNSDGTLSPVEMFSAIGPVLVDSEGALPQALLKTFDVCKKGAIQLAEYFYGSRVLLRGTVKDRLLYLFALFDTESKGTIVLSEFVAGMKLVTALTQHTRSANRLSSAGRLGGSASPRGQSTMMGGGGSSSVAGLRTTPESMEAFSKELFQMIDANHNGEIDVDEFCRAMTHNPTVINALKKISSIDENNLASSQSDNASVGSAKGMPAVIYSATLENASNPNTIVTFGHPRWREMVQILAGIEHACRHPEANRVVDMKTSFGVKVPHDCSAWGNHSLAGEVALRTMRNNQLAQQQRAGAARGAASGGANGNAAFQQLLNNPPSAVLPSGTNETITFNDYCPAVFHTIRRSFGISNEDYLQSIGISQLRSGLLFGNISCLYEMISSGRSGSFFYSTHDNKYILKTIPMAESVILRKMLASYYEHVIKYPNTLLTRFCGLHALIRNGRKLIFVVMQNIFQNKVPVHETYDLKGSTVGRSTPMALRAPGVALKDNDFGARKLYMRGHIKRELIKQIQNDAQLLASYNLNDYSFLLGIHTSFDGPLDKANSPPCNRPSHNLYQQFYGGIEGAALIDPSKEARAKDAAAMNDVNALKVTNEDGDWGVVETDNRSRMGVIPLSYARHGGGGGASGTTSPRQNAADGGRGGSSSPTSASGGDYGAVTQTTSAPFLTDPNRPLRYEIYFVGIIDMLTDYGMKKRGEHYSKSILYDSKQVSCIAPQEYLQRYIQYLDSIMVAID